MMFYHGLRSHSTFTTGARYGGSLTVPYHYGSCRFSEREVMTDQRADGRYPQGGCGAQAATTLRAADAVKLAYNVDQGDSLFISPLCAADAVLLTLMGMAAFG